MNIIWNASCLKNEKKHNPSRYSTVRHHDRGILAFYEKAIANAYSVNFQLYCMVKSVMDGSPFAPLCICEITDYCMLNTVGWSDFWEFVYYISHVVPNCYRTSIPKFHILMLLFQLSEGPGRALDCPCDFLKMKTLSRVRCKNVLNPSTLLNSLYGAICSAH